MTNNNLDIIVLADLHFSNFSSLAPPGDDLLSSRAKDIAYSVEWTRKYAIKNKIPLIVIAGDVFHKRDKISVPIFNLAYSSIKSFKDDGIETIIIVGNHDQTTKGGITHSLKSFKEIAQVVDIPTIYTCPISGYHLYLIPFIEESGRIKQTVSELLQRNKKCYKDIPKILISHLGVKGGSLGFSSAFSKNMVSPGELQPNKFLAVILGHFHKHQKLGKNIWYSGAPLQHNFGDCGEPRGFVRVRSAFENGEFNLKVEHIEIPGLPKFHQGEGKDFNFQDINKQDYYKVTNPTKNQVKILSDFPRVFGINKLTPIDSKKKYKINLGNSWETNVEEYVLLKKEELTKKEQMYFIRVGKDIISSKEKEVEN